MTVGMLPENVERAIHFKKKMVVGSIKRGYEEGDVNELSKHLDMLEELGGDLLAWNKRSWEIGKQRELGVYRKQLERANEEKEAAEKNLKEAKTMLENVNRETEKLKKELNEVKPNLAAVILETGKLTKLHDETKERLTLMKKESEMLKQELLDKQQELTTVKNENESLQETEDNIQAHLQQLNKDLKSTASALTATYNENEILTNKIQNLERQLKSVQNENERDTQEKLTAANDETNNKTKLLRDLNEQGEAAIDGKRIISKCLNETKDNMLFMLILGLTPFLDSFPLSLWGT